MKKLFNSFLRITKPSKKAIKVIVKHGNTQTILDCQEGQNLMDVTNKIVNQDVNVYGLCDKQLACTTCSVQILNHQDKLPQASQQQLDIITSIPGACQNTRMACQITLKQELDNLTIRIPNKRSNL